LRTIALLVLTLALTACVNVGKAPKTQWDAYYAAVEDTPSAHVVVVPPQGTTVPMAKLIARYVVDNLKKHKISAEIGDGKPSQGRYFILTGAVEDNFTDPRVRYRWIIRWSLSDAGGRVISTHSEGVDATQKEWDFGSARLLNAIGINTAGPVAQMVLAETKTKVPLDVAQRGLLVDRVAGLGPEDSGLLIDALKNTLRTSDVLVTGDARQASFRLGGQVDMTPAPGARVDVRITWVVFTMDGQELGRAVQENQIQSKEIQGGWGALAPRVGAAAAVGVEHIFSGRTGPVSGSLDRTLGEPPTVNMPGEPGRAPPPPQ
jgi:hypothetical protein